MGIQCRECRAGLEHCHGSVVHHFRFRVECTEDGCESPEVLHSFSVDCESVGCRCGQVAGAAVGRTG